MVDSGAFSAWKSGARIGLWDYGAFCMAVADRAFAFVSLDVIPADQRPETVRAAAKSSYSNWSRLRAMGVETIPVYHRGEDLGCLDRYLDSGAPYIGLGALATVTDAQRIQTLDRVWDRIRGHRTASSVKVHGFGLATPAMLSRYPWYSVDSSSWGITAGTGDIIAASGAKITVSQRRLRPGRNRVGGLFNNFGLGNRPPDLNAGEVAAVRAYLKPLGFTLKDVQTSRLARCVVNAWQMTMVARKHNVRLFLSYMAYEPKLFNRLLRHGLSDWLFSYVSSAARSHFGTGRG